jgi:hypothetical protein
MKLKEKCQKLIVVPGHGLYRTGTPVEEENWFLLSFQKGNGDFRRYLEHIETGGELAKADPQSLLVFSGGYSREGFHGSEGLGYLRAATALNILDDNLVQRVFAEEYARDSYENVLYATALFYQRTGRLPRCVTVVGFGFKAERFHLHIDALGLPGVEFQYVSVNDPGDLEAAREGESKTLASFRADPHGISSSLAAKRRERNPNGYHHSYDRYCSTSPHLARLLAVNVLTDQAPLSDLPSLVSANSSLLSPLG